jgi:hemin uptake protein HemP
MSNALSPVVLSQMTRNPSVAAPVVPEAQVSSRSLLGGASTLVIEHMGMHYTLRATRNGKLILTK